MRKTWLVGMAMAAVLVAGWSASSEAKDETERGEHPRAFLGVFLSGDREGETGVRVDGILRDSAADRARMEEGDVIVSFDGRSVEDLEDLGERLRSASPEDRVAIEVLRDGRRQTFDVTLGSRADAGEALRGMGRPKLGVQVVPTTPELREHMGGDMDRGVLVGKVIPDTPAERAGLATGDLITAVNGKSVHNVAGLMAALRNKAMVGGSLDLEIVRDHRTMHLEATLP